MAPTLLLLASLTGQSPAGDPPTTEPAAPPADAPAEGAAPASPPTEVLTAPAVPAAPVTPETSMAVIPLTAGEGIEAKVAEAIAGSVVAQLRLLPNARVITQQEIEALLSFEMKKDLLGCTDSMCVSEIGGALGVEFLTIGSISKLGESWLVTLKLVNIAEAATDGQVDRRLKGGNVDDVLDILPGMVAELFPDRWPFGFISVETPTPGATVTIDGEVAGKSPIALKSVEPGTYEVAVNDKCFEPISERVVVKRTRTQSLKLDAKPKLAGIKVTSKDASGDDVASEVKVDGTLVGQTPGQYFVPACAKLVVVAAPDGRSWENAITLTPGETAELNAMLPDLVVAGAVKEEWDPNWWMVGAGGLAIIIGIVLDAAPASAGNHEVDVLDFVPLGFYVGGGITSLIGIL